MELQRQACPSLSVSLAKLLLKELAIRPEPGQPTAVRKWDPKVQGCGVCRPSPNEDTTSDAGMTTRLSLLPASLQMRAGSWPAYCVTCSCISQQSRVETHPVVASSKAAAQQPVVSSTRRRNSSVIRGWVRTQWFHASGDSAVGGPGRRKEMVWTITNSGQRNCLVAWKYGVRCNRRRPSTYSVLRTCLSLIFDLVWTWCECARSSLGARSAVAAAPGPYP